MSPPLIRPRPAPIRLTLADWVREDGSAAATLDVDGLTVRYRPRPAPGQRRRSA